MIPLDDTDVRIIKLSFQNRPNYCSVFNLMDINLKLEQLDLLRILKMCRQCNNIELARKITKFIYHCDKYEDVKTDWDRLIKQNIPRRNSDEVINKNKEEKDYETKQFKRFFERFWSKFSQ
jgi:hypothetical protein|tara:strand:- start:15361 stop:15723 length:363 start_codon:yes stop_codon:yes gene_type:complete